jgi:hypothetical protein
LGEVPKIWYQKPGEESVHRYYVDGEIMSLK